MEKVDWGKLQSWIEERIRIFLSEHPEIKGEFYPFKHNKGWNGIRLKFWFVPKDNRRRIAFNPYRYTTLKDEELNVLGEFVAGLLQENSTLRGKRNYYYSPFLKKEEEGIVTYSLTSR